MVFPFFSCLACHKHLVPLFGNLLLETAGQITQFHHLNLTSTVRPREFAHLCLPPFMADGLGYYHDISPPILPSTVHPVKPPYNPYLLLTAKPWFAIFWRTSLFLGPIHLLPFSKTSRHRTRILYLTPCTNCLVSFHPVNVSRSTYS